MKRLFSPIALVLATAGCAGLEKPRTYLATPERLAEAVLTVNAEESPWNRRLTVTADWPGVDQPVSELWTRVRVDTAERVLSGSHSNDHYRSESDGLLRTLAPVKDETGVELSNAYQVISFETPEAFSAWIEANGLGTDDTLMVALRPVADKPLVWRWSVVGSIPAQADALQLVTIETGSVFNLCTVRPKGSELVRCFPQTQLRSLLAKAANSQKDLGIVAGEVRELSPERSIGEQLARLQEQAPGVQWKIWAESPNFPRSMRDRLDVELEQPHFNETGQLCGRVNYADGTPYLGYAFCAAPSTLHEVTYRDRGVDIGATLGAIAAVPAYTLLFGYVLLIDPSPEP